MSKQLTKQQKAKYLLLHGVYCPYCDNHKIEAGPATMGEFDIKCLVRCQVCEKHWVDVYQVTDIIPCKPQKRVKVLPNKGLCVLLKSAGNPDFKQFAPVSKPDTYVVESQGAVGVLEAARRCRKYIKDNELGFGNWAGGQILKDGKPYLYVSYNGKIWFPDEKEAKEKPYGYHGSLRPYTEQLDANK